MIWYNREFHAYKINGRLIWVILCFNAITCRVITDKSEEKEKKQNAIFSQINFTMGADMDSAVNTLITMMTVSRSSIITEPTARIYMINLFLIAKINAFTHILLYFT